MQEVVKNSSYIIALHEYVQIGPGHDLRKFLLKYSPKTFLFITHPLLYVKDTYKKSSKYELYVNGKLKKEASAFHWHLPEPLLYIKDFIYTLLWLIETRESFNLFVGLDPLNAIAGIALKKLGYVRKTVYYSIDYFPRRFDNKYMNWIYHQIDKFAVRFSNETWNVGGRMVQARALGNNMTGEVYLKKQFVVPIGVWFNDIKRNPVDKFDKYKLIYAGGFVPYMGIDLVIKALPKVLKKIPYCRLELIGGGEALKDWQQLAQKLKVEKYINFEPWIEDRETFQLRLSKAAIGMAPFNYNILDDKVKNADPGKIKDYTAAGLPVITTKAIYTYRQLEDSKCGIVVDYQVDQLAEAVIKLLTNQKLLLEYRKNALKYSSQFDWNKLFTENLNRILT